MKLEKIAKDISKSEKPGNMNSRIICIDGCGGAGKTTFATKLSSELNNCPIIHTDDFASWEEPLSWYTRMKDQVLKPLSENTKAYYQKYDWGKRKLTKWISIEPQSFIIIEGVSSCRIDFRPYISYGIFIETNQDLRLQRGLDRDGEHMKEQWLKWMKEEALYLKEHQPQKFANLIISGE